MILITEEVGEIRAMFNEDVQMRLDMARGLYRDM